jgi:hypothetical protein
VNTVIQNNEGHLTPREFHEPVNALYLKTLGNHDELRVESE